MKIRFPYAEALPVADALAAVLAPECERIIVAGSLRRQKQMVGDIELVFAPRFGPGKLPGDLFEREQCNLPELCLLMLIHQGQLEARTNVNGSKIWGQEIKLLRHVATGIGVDAFAIPMASWWNYLVCRTGPAESNTRICVAARERGWKWEPYTTGFRRLDVHGNETEERSPAMTCEEDVFAFAGLPYAAPEDR